MAITFLLCVFCLVLSRAVLAHDLSKRTAGDGKLYVYSSRKGCVSVVSNAICPVNWKLSPVYAKAYNRSSQTIQALNHLKVTGANDQCISDIRDVQCSQSTPRCSEDGSKDYGDAKKSCKNIHASCPSQIADLYKQQNLCGTILTGKQPLASCVFPSSSITGACPQPTYKMPKDFFQSYVRSSKSLESTFKKLDGIKKLNGSDFLSANCMSTLKKMSCPALYCSADENRLLVNYNKDDCEKTVTECIDKNLPSITKSLLTIQKVNDVKNRVMKACELYPSPPAETENAPGDKNPGVSPPPVGPSNGPTGRSTKLTQFAFQVFLFSFVAFIFTGY